jgi:excisionase family DNA binding protein
MDDTPKGRGPKARRGHTGAGDPGGPPADLVTPARAAKRLRVDVATVYRWIRKGWLRAWERAGGDMRVSRAEVLALARPVQVEPRQTAPLPSWEPAPAPARIDTPAHRAAVEELRKLGLG